MAKEFFVIRNNRRIVYEQGHYDVAGAEAVVKADRMKHPLSIYHIVQIVESYGQFRKKVK